MKKIGILFLISILLINTVVCAHAIASIDVQEKLVDVDHTIVVIEKNEKYEKVKITNTLSGKVEFIELFRDSDMDRYVLTNEEDGNKTLVFNDGHYVRMIENGIVVLKVAAPESTIMGSGNDMSLFSYGDWTGWSTYNYTHYNILALGFSAAVTYIASFYGASPSTAVIYDVVSSLLTGGFDVTFATKEFRKRFDYYAGIAEEDAYIKFYYDSNRNAQVGTEALHVITEGMID